MRMLASGVAVVLCLAISACAGTSGSNGIARGMSSMDAEVDYGKVLAVNDWAVKRHATVMWINYPKKSAQRLKDENG